MTRSPQSGPSAAFALPTARGPQVTDQGPNKAALEAFVHEVSLLPRDPLFKIGDGKTKSISRSQVVADKIVFGEDSRLIFKKVDADFLAIVAEEIVFSGPTYTATVMRSPSIKAKKPKRRKDRERPPRRPRRAGHGKQGRDGKKGATGRHGKHGRTISLPPVWIFAGKITLEDGGESDHINLTLDFRGIRGGPGGDAGAGQPGGKGGDGGRGRSDWHECRKRTGGGGRGGKGGRGGRGGDGGRPTAGATIHYVGPQDVLDELAHATEKNKGGKGGKGGLAGRSGSGGRGGAGGARTGHCQGIWFRRDGTTPEPRRPRRGKNWSKKRGPKGKIFRHLVGGS